MAAHPARCRPPVLLGTAHLARAGRPRVRCCREGWLRAGRCHGGCRRKYGRRKYGRGQAGCCSRPSGRFHPQMTPAMPPGRPGRCRSGTSRAGYPEGYPYPVARRCRPRHPFRVTHRGHGRYPCPARLLLPGKHWPGCSARSGFRPDCRNADRLYPAPANWPRPGRAARARCPARRRTCWPAGPCSQPGLQGCRWSGLPRYRRYALRHCCRNAPCRYRSNARRRYRRAGPCRYR
jgi:hypothetical protein